MIGEALYYGLAVLFYTAPRLLYEIHLQAPPRFLHQPSTLFVTNHKRDLDSIILPATLYVHGAHPRRPLWFAGREDMFLRGFLATYEVVPAWFRRLLYEIDLTSVLRVLRVLPVRRFPERTMEEALREALALFGEVPVSRILAPEEAARFLAFTGSDLRLGEVLDWRLRDLWRGPVTLRAFAPHLHDTLAQQQRDVVRGQLRALAALLDRGGMLYLAPEGVLSPDGRLQAFRSGFKQILEMISVQIRICPVCIAYDYMVPGRLRVFITIGEPHPADGPPDQVEQGVRRELAALHTMTCSQVASRVVWEHVQLGQDRLDLGRFADEVRSLAASLQQEGLRVDEVLLTPAAQNRVADWVRFALGKRVLVRQDDDLVIDGTLLARPATHWDNPVRYCVNELQSVRAILVEAAEQVPNRVARSRG